MALASFDFHVFVTLTMTGLAQGAILALAALGFVLVYKASGVINFAQGQFLLIGGYVIWVAIVHWGLPWPVAVGVAVVSASAAGILIERLALRPLVGQPVISVIMVTAGLAFVLQGLVLWVWGPDSRGFPRFIPSDSVQILGAPVGKDRLIGIAVTAVTLAAFGLFFQRSKHGIAMRAVADDQQAALAMGISVRHVFALAWALAGVSAVIGGMLVANINGVSLQLSDFGLLVFPVVILGGLDSIPGVIVGGAAIGLLGQYSQLYPQLYLGPDFHGFSLSGLGDVAPYVVLVLILLVKPYGLFGQARIERV